MNDQDQINEDERQEAATEEPINGAAGVRALPHFPSGADGTEPGEKKHTMDFGKFHVTRAAIPGRTILTFRRKQEVNEHGSIVSGRIIVATIVRSNEHGKTVCDFYVESYMPGESFRTLFHGCSEVSMSKTEKMVYKMVKCDIKETQRRHITRKRKRDAAKQQAHDSKPEGK